MDAELIALCGRCDSGALRSLQRTNVELVDPHLGFRRPVSLPDGPFDSFAIECMAQLVGGDAVALARTLNIPLRRPANSFARQKLRPPKASPPSPSPAKRFLSMQSEIAKRGHSARNEFQPNSQRQKPFRSRAGGGAACAFADSGLTSIQPSRRISSFAFELETVSSFPVSMFRTVRNRTWFIESPPRPALLIIR
jgi:hypothetical protein